MSDFHGVRCDSCIKTEEGFTPPGWIKIEEYKPSEGILKLTQTIKRHFCSFSCLKTFVETGVVREPKVLSETN